MPRYLRWTAAVTTGIILQFAFFIAVGAVAVGTGNKRLTGAVGLLVTLGSTLVPTIVALAINDWLRERYGPTPKAVRTAASPAAPVPPQSERAPLGS